MKTQYEPVTVSNAERRAIDRAADALASMADDTTRAEAAEVARKFGLAVFIGERHLAIHASVNGDRLAVVTHDGKDWR